MEGLALPLAHMLVVGLTKLNRGFGVVEHEDDFIEEILYETEDFAVVNQQAGHSSMFDAMLNAFIWLGLALLVLIIISFIVLTYMGII